MLRYNIHLRFIARLYGLVHHAEGFFREAGPLLEWHLKIMRQITRQQREKKERERQRDRGWGEKKKRRSIICIWRAREREERADLVCERRQGGFFDGMLGGLLFEFLDLSKCMVRLAKGTHTRARTHTYTHTHISPTSDPRKLWVGVGFQMATQSHHCAPVNTMKTKLTHRWHSTPPPPTHHTTLCLTLTSNTTQVEHRIRQSGGTETWEELLKYETPRGKTNATDSPSSENS